MPFGGKIFKREREKVGKCDRKRQIRDKRKMEIQ
jgi:hypothetical protein